MMKIIPIISKSKKFVGDEFSYTYILPQTPSVPSINLSFSNPSDNESILVVTQSVKAHHKGIQYQAHIISFKTGVIQFPSANIFDYHIEPVSVTIDSVISPGTTVNFKADYPPYQSYADVWLGLFILLLIAGIFFGYRFFRKYRTTQQSILTPEKVHAIWEQTMAYFSKQDMPLDVKPYYAASSEKLKTFLKIGVHIDILDLTGREIKSYFKTHPLQGETELLDCLDASDMVKFAKYTPTHEEFQHYQTTALKFLSMHEPSLEESVS